MGTEIKAQLERIERNTLLASKNVLTFEDVAFLTGFSKSYLYKLTSSGKIPHYKPNGKMIYFDREELEDWLKQNRVASDNEIEEMADNYLAIGG
ncbi:MAG: helix-turn-helix domain-containing protein [Fermentimonas sp.]|jgi:excisionase family DNA binding protein